MADGVLIMTDRGVKKVKVFKRELCEVTVLAGSGGSGAKDHCGSETSVSFSQPTAVCCEEGSKTVYVTDISNGGLKEANKYACLIEVPGESVKAVN